jgi:hypothetical protein
MTDYTYGAGQRYLGVVERPPHLLPPAPPVTCGRTVVVEVTGTPPDR